MGGMMALVWRKHFVADPGLAKEVLFYDLILGAQVGCAYVYPAYTFAFNKLSGWPQAVFALLLPAMEIAVKNGMSYLVCGQEDVRSEFIILNTEAFHALFVATCLQGSTYIATTAILVAADFLHACLSLRDVNAIVEEIRESLGNERRDENDERNGQAAVNSMSSPRTLHYIEAAMFLLENHDHLHCEPHTHSLTVFVAFT